METKTHRSGLTLAAILDTAISMAATDGLESLTVGELAKRLNLSKSGVFSRIGSREALQKAVVDEYGRRFIAAVFVPAMQAPKGLPRLDAIVQRWIAWTRDVESQTGCLFIAGAFELDDRDGELRDHLLHEVTRWRACLRRTVLQAVDSGELKASTDAELLVSELSGLTMGLLHDVRFLRDAKAPERARTAWQRLIASYKNGD